MARLFQPGQCFRSPWQGQHLLVVSELLASLQVCQHDHTLTWLFFKGLNSRQAWTKIRKYLNIVWIWTCLKLQVGCSTFHKCTVSLVARSLDMTVFEFQRVLKHEPDWLSVACSPDRPGAKGGKRPEGYMMALGHTAEGKCSWAHSKRWEEENWSRSKRNWGAWRAPSTRQRWEWGAHMEESDATSRAWQGVSALALTGEQRGHRHPRNRNRCESDSQWVWRVMGLTYT